MMTLCFMLHACCLVADAGYAIEPGMCDAVILIPSFGTIMLPQS